MGCRLVVAVSVVVLALCWTFFVHSTKPVYPVHSKGLVVLTGASTGIGKHAALYLHSQGYHVMAGVRKEKDALQLVKESGKTNRLIPVTLDVTKHEQIEKMVQEVEAFLKKTKLPLVGLVNNAGIGYFAPLEFVDIPTARRTFEVNYFGLLDTTKALIPLLRANSGRIVNIGSVAGVLATQFSSVYAGTKFAVEAVSDTLRRELGKQGVAVSLIQPAVVESNFVETSDMDNFDYLDEDAKLRYKVEKRNEGRKKALSMASPATVTSEAIFDALTNPTPQTRYVVANVFGIEASIVTRLLWLLPDSIVDILAEL
eukprot:CAMPEP_0201475842 /NCGR_PEP_ID=MMETSP0151_2-20130828/1190_1 /ASSEMBLY_ACC=CAM_ASM_000257 /TAXON_ID=200890 /ORGANISM="Paramoeba atlantica, Strain 621/1 / CCAP 1560/9" /LENGTH=312 /DNA_ID=CAMNT_0047856049 /DNA_START=42 /DNA_END=980 /DNA_ORIENTATION=-